jgi:hypothetical protein
MKVVENLAFISQIVMRKQLNFKYALNFISFLILYHLWCRISRVPVYFRPVEVIGGDFRKILVAPKAAEN